MRGRKRLSVEEKARRGTLEPSRERKYQGGTGLALVEPLRRQERAGERRPYGLLSQHYQAGVLDGSLTACRWVKLACERQVRDLAEGSEWTYLWDQEQADGACEFVEQLPHVAGRWATPLIHLEPWQVFLVQLLFGWRVRADPSRRRFTTLYLEVARKSAKSTLMAALAYYHLLREDEPGASVICGATTGAQARIVFGMMQQMGRRSAFLAGQGVQVFANAIVTPEGSVKPVNSKASTQDGLNPSCIVLDEGHAQDFGLHDVLKSAQGGRSNPLMLCPTTAGENLLSVGYALHQQVEKLLDRVFDVDHLLGIIYTLDQGDDWRDATKWIKSCPMIGISPKLEYVQRFCEDAQQVPGQEGEFRIKMCSEWMHAASRWLSMTAWDKCAEPSLKLEDFKGQKCWMGVDLAVSDDLAAVGLLFMRDDDLIGFARCYLPRGVVEARARRVPEYRAWVDEGLLTMSEGTSIDYSVIEQDIRQFCQDFQVEDIVFDWFGSHNIVSNLFNSGFPAVRMEKNRKTYTKPSVDFGTRVRHGRFKHDGNSLLKWTASNACADIRVDGSLLPKKESAESPNKIDPIDALLQANKARLDRYEEADREPSIYFVGGRRRA